MVTATTYRIYISGQLPNLVLSGDVNPTTHEITIFPAGAAMIDISINRLTDASGLPAAFAALPIKFRGSVQPAFVSWALLSPTDLLLTNLNWNMERVEFDLQTVGGVSQFQAVPATPVALGIDPTIVNTYIPPPVPPPAPCQPVPPLTPGRPVSPARPEEPELPCADGHAERRIA